MRRDDLIFEQKLNNGRGSLTILVGGYDNEYPKAHMDKLVKEYVENEEYNDFTEITLSEPHVRVIIKGINDLDFQNFNKDIHKLKTFIKNENQ